MIDVKQLRIGSIVANKHGFQFEVVGIFKDQILCDFKGNEGDVFEFKPSEVFGVPLSDEWLVDKFGFIPSMECKEQLVLDKIVFQRYDDTQARIWWRGRYLGICQRLEYVHQLQNLYYALTGTELELNATR